MASDRAAERPTGGEPAEAPAESRATQAPAEPGTAQPPAESRATQAPDRDLAAGMTVVDAAGAYAGTVKQVREQDFLLQREVQRDVYLPRRVVAEVRGSQVSLTLRLNDISAVELETPPLFGRT